MTDVGAAAGVSVCSLSVGAAALGCIFSDDGMLVETASLACSGPCRGSCCFLFLFLFLFFFSV